MSKKLLNGPAGQITPGPWWGANANRYVTSEQNWKQPHRWAQRARAERTSTRVFCASMADVFEDHRVANAWRPRLWDVINDTRCVDPAVGGLQWILLTKRVENIKRFLPENWGPNGWAGLWLGVTIEGPAQSWRADVLREIPAAVRWISYEPAIGKLPDNFNLAGIQWLVAGGESGPDYRADDVEWYRHALQLCKAASPPVKFFMKQRAHYKSGRDPFLDGRQWLEYPEVHQPPQGSLGGAA